jgi:hypothetical protein
MPTLALTAPNTPPVSTPLRGKLLNVFVSPGEVFEEVVASPPKPACWLVPTLFVCFTAIISLLVAPVRERRAAEVRQLAESGAIVSSDTGKLSSRLLPEAALTVATSAVAGTFWSAFVLWFIGRMFLKTRFPFWKSIEVVGLTGMILALGTLLTALLIAATGDTAARPALSIFVGQSNPGNKVYAGLAAIHFFHLWTATVLSVGLSKLARVSLSEAAFWVFGYWVALRLALIWLA